VTVAVVVIIAAVAVPGMHRLIRDNRILTTANDFVAAINRARSEAIKHKARMTMCPANDQPDKCGAAGWANGWIVFEDNNSDGKRDVGETIVMTRNPLLTSTLLAAVGFDGNQCLQISGTGALVNTTGLGNDFMKVCQSGESGNYSRVVVVSPNGHPSVNANISCP
jgi:type IV fimbrial biogenesis protein FimT